MNGQMCIHLSSERPVVTLHMGPGDSSWIALTDEGKPDHQSDVRVVIFYDHDEQLRVFLELIADTAGLYVTP
jgi:hypothetical protein